MSEYMTENMSEQMPDRMAEYLLEKMSDLMLERLPERMSEHMREKNQIECLNKYAVYTSRCYVRNYVRIVFQGGDHSKKVIEKAFR